MAPFREAAESTAMFQRSLPFDTESRPPNKKGAIKIENPTVFFAYVEIREIERETKRIVVVFDCVEANWLREVPNDAELAFRAARNAPLLIVWLELDASSPSATDIIEEEQWYLLRVGNIGLQAVAYASLDGPEIPAAIELEPLSQTDNQFVKGKINLQQVPYAAINQIDQHLSILTSVQPSFVDIINVGQGNCNAICDANGQPILYYDFGGGCLANRRTYPNYPIGINFCFQRNPMIILSHWDFDHWYSATRVRSAMSCDWLAPRQAVGPTAWKFASLLVSAGKLKLWPSQASVSHGGAISIIKSNGTSRNDSGLVLMIALSSGDVILPGDAGFQHFSWSGSIIGLVATHHGSGAHLQNIPTPLGGGVLVYSYGTGNTFGHPDGQARIAYWNAGWQRSLETPGGSVAILATLGNTLPKIGCTASFCSGNLCDLAPTQV